MKLQVPGFRDEARMKLGDAFAEALGGAAVKGAVRVEAARSDEKPQVIEAADDDVVELEFEGGIRQFVSVGQLRTDYGLAPSREAADVLAVPARLGHEEASRGLVTDLVLKAFRIFGVPIEKQVARKVADHFEQKIITGLHAWTADAGLENAVVDDPGRLAGDDPLLVFLHGTASSSLGSFGALPPAIWEKLHERYPGRVFGFEHRSLTRSPIDNAVELLEVLPKGARLHLVSHSRGGMIGELLCRAEARRVGEKASRAPFDETDLKQLAGAPYGEQLASLKRLGALLEAKRPSVERFARVACPAAGTILASKRLDRLFSLLSNVVGLVKVPGLEDVLDALASLAAAAAKERTDPQELPGIEAMMPSSPLVKVLNRPDVTVKADLSVIAGDIEGAGVWQRLKVFATDLFYWQDHDLVIHTKSMYGGARRPGGARYFFDKGSDVSHFSYFRNTRTAERLLEALTREEGRDTGFKRLDPGLEPSLQRSAAARGGTPPARGTVFVLPGIMGSHLAVGDDRIWLDPVSLALGKLRKLTMSSHGVVAEGLVGLAYGDLVDYLEKRYEVIPFPFDWRRPILEEARRFGTELRGRLEATAQPVRIVAHSMGGVVLRAMIAECDGLWDDFKKADGRAVLLGVPNGGSYVINSVLLGREPILRYLERVDFFHDTKETLEIVSRFRGLLDLLPAGPDDPDYFSIDTWKRLHDAWDEDWVLPAKDDLDRAKALREVLADERTIDTERMTYIAGKDHATPIAVEVDESARGAERIVIKATEEGDGRVPWETGLLPGVKTWYVDATHGNLADHRPAFPAIVDLLEHGATKRLATSPPVSRGSTTPFVLPAEDVPYFPDGADLEAAALGRSHEVERSEPGLPVDIRVVHGSLRFIDAPILIGHYRGDSIVGAERLLDKQLGGRLSRRRQLELYPGPIETSEVVLDERNKPAGAIVVGLGEVGKLSPGELRATLARGLVQYAIEATERDPAAPFLPLRVAPLIVGSGEGGLSVRDAVLATAKAAIDANDAIAMTALADRARIAAVDIVEIRLDRAVQAVKALRAAVTEIDLAGLVELADRNVVTGRGGWRRVAYSADADWWSRLQITEKDGALDFLALTDSARAEAEMLPTQRASLDAFLRDAVGSVRDDPQLSATLFELLLPNRLKEAAPQDRSVVLVLDERSARYPWELLRDGQRDGPHGENEPFAVRAGLIRQLRTDVFREQVVKTTDKTAFVVGDPPSGFAKLPGAKQEAEHVQRELEHAGFTVETAIERDFRVVLGGLYAKPYRVLHLAGHGVFDHEIEDEPAQAPDGRPTPGREKQRVSGMVLGDGVFLTAAEINQMRVVPELVFINCCHLGRETGERGPGPQRFHELAANLGTQLIRMGARAVVAAGWAVQDDAADTFARTFYRQMLAGATFGQAVLEARKETWNDERARHYNTWGAYQCYGDPDYVLVPAGKSGAGGGAAEPAVVEEAITEIDNLTESASDATESWRRKKSEELEGYLKTIPDAWKEDAKLLASAGRAWGDLGDFERAVESYERAARLEEATLSVKSLEQSANLRARWATELWQRSARRDRARAKKEIERARADVERLIAFGETAERRNLLGSTYRREALVSTRKRDRIAALKGMEQEYGRAHEMMLERLGRTDYYPAGGRLAARLALYWVQRKAEDQSRPPAEIGEWLEEIERDLDAARSERYSFWDATARPDLELLRRLWLGDLDQGDHERTIVRAYVAERSRASTREFRSIVDNAEFLAEMYGSGAHARCKALAKALASIAAQLRAAIGEQG